MLCGTIIKRDLTMNLVLRPIANVSDPVWSVIISLVILLAGVLYYIVYIISMANTELKSVKPKIESREVNYGSNDTPKQEELLQLPSDGD
jgi:membrane protein insertase Oxa1/YidC/SpoIIIJ